MRGVPNYKLPNDYRERRVSAHMRRVIQLLRQIREDFDPEAFTLAELSAERSLTSSGSLADPRDEVRDLLRSLIEKGFVKQTSEEGEEEEYRVTHAGMDFEDSEDE